jgi:enamine deaminase RidA (YjgF/YER057c/UK114 family)
MLSLRAANTAEMSRFEVGARLSDMAVYNGVAYLAGQIPDDDSADALGQTQQVLAAIDELLRRAGTDKSKILMATIYLANISDFAAMNAAWDAWVVAGHTPPRATVEARLARPTIRVEIVVTAAVQ